MTFYMVVSHKMDRKSMAGKSPVRVQLGQKL